MLYNLPSSFSSPGARLPQWVSSRQGIPGWLPDGQGVHIPVESANMLTVGVTGTGKTRSFVIPAAKARLAADPRCKGVFFETKRTFLNTFLTPGDKLITYDPSLASPGQLFQWNLIREIRQADSPEAEMRQITDFLFRDLLARAENNRAWVEAARNTFLAVLRVVVDCTREEVSNWQLVNALRKKPIPELLHYIAKHPRNHSLLRKDFSYTPGAAYTPTRRAGDILFFFNQVLELFGGSFESRGSDTIHDYLHDRYGRNLFLLYDLRTAQASRPFLCYFLKKIKDEKMSLSSTLKAPLILVLDEVDKLADGGQAADFGLFQAATLGREYGLQVQLSTQSMENLYGLAPDFREHITQGGLSGFPVIAAFRPGDGQTIRTLQTLFGSRRRAITTMPLSRYDHPTVRSEVEPLVTEADFASLNTGEAYVKIASSDPLRVAIELTE